MQAVTDTVPRHGPESSACPEGRRRACPQGWAGAGGGLRSNPVVASSSPVDSPSQWGRSFPPAQGHLPLVAGPHVEEEE